MGGKQRKKRGTHTKRGTCRRKRVREEGGKEGEIAI